MQCVGRWTASRSMFGQNFGFGGVARTPDVGYEVEVSLEVGVGPAFFYSQLPGLLISMIIKAGMVNMIYSILKHSEVIWTTVIW